MFRNKNKKLERLIHLFFGFARFSYIQKSGQAEIEWFHFKEKINIAKYIAILNEMVEDLFPEVSTNIDSISEVKTDKININTGILINLINLKSIGATRAAEIIKYRDKNGPFKSIQDLLVVPKIGQKTLDKIKNNIII